MWFNNSTTGHPVDDARRLSNRELLVTLGLFWGIVTASSIIHGWDTLASDPLVVWRTLTADAIGAGIAFGMAMLIGRSSHQPLMKRIGLMLVYAFISVLMYVMGALCLVVPVLPTPPSDNVLLQVSRMVISNFWIFGAWGALYLLVETNIEQTEPDAPTIQVNKSFEGDKTQKNNPHHILQAGPTAAGLEGAWFWSFQAIYWG